ncbi:hypothetical protein B0T16DRAFT_79009 [Cercophora newfieldiana]|uniref:Secreted protein n=1 Tax=Cercophora newfieldiana TaxID=92897 RepID=A0AA39YEZ2_9PEZI|nr:hypothetical protein B0T16DRAFT_79009 [Cercophora newfieldiana]
MLRRRCSFLVAVLCCDLMKTIPPSQIFLPSVVQWPGYSDLLYVHPPSSKLGSLSRDKLERRFLGRRQRFLG